LRAALALPKDIPRSRDWFDELDPDNSESSEDLLQSGRKRLTRAMRYMLVCRRWLGIVQTIAAEQVVNYTEASLHSFCRYVSTTKGPVLTRSFTAYLAYPDISEESGLVELLDQQLERLGSLQHVRMLIGLSATAWNALNYSSGSCLTRLEVTLTSGDFNFVCMPVLSSLRLSATASLAKFSTNGGCLFPAVKELGLHDYTLDAVLLQFLTATRSVRVPVDLRIAR